LKPNPSLTLNLYYPSGFYWEKRISIPDNYQKRTFPIIEVLYGAIIVEYMTVKIF